MCPAGGWPRNGWAVAEVVADQAGVVSAQAKRVRYLFMRIEVPALGALHHTRYHGMDCACSWSEHGDEAHHLRYHQHVCACPHSHKCAR